MDTEIKLSDWLTMVAIVVGPLSAVGITLWIEKARRIRERQLYVMRMLLTTRHTPADPQYNAAINLIPAEFHDQTKVMDEWRKYHERVNEHVDAAHEADHQRRISAAQSGMILQIMHHVGLTNLSEGDIQTQAYISQGFVDRDLLYLDSLRAMPQIAATMEKQRELTEIIVGNIPRRAPEPPTVPDVRR